MPNRRLRHRLLCNKFRFYKKKKSLVIFGQSKIESSAKFSLVFTPRNESYLIKDQNEEFWPNWKQQADNQLMSKWSSSNRDTRRLFRPNLIWKLDGEEKKKKKKKVMPKRNAECRWMRWRDYWQITVLKIPLAALKIQQQTNSTAEIHLWQVNQCLYLMMGLHSDSTGLHLFVCLFEDNVLVIHSIQLVKLIASESASLKPSPHSQVEPLFCLAIRGCRWIGFKYRVSRKLATCCTSSDCCKSNQNKFKPDSIITLFFLYYYF